MKKTIIFDAGRVLFEEEWEKIDKKIKEKYGVTILVHSSGNKKAGEEYLKEAEGKGDIKKVFELLGAKPKNIPELIKDYQKEYIKNKIINGGLLNLIRKLKKDYQIICLTDTHKLHFEANQSINFFKDFDKVFASHIQKIRKNNPNAFKKLLKNLKIKSNETLFIDDNKTNVKNAKSIGIKTIHYTEFPKIRKLKKEIYKNLK
ncbi:MAG: HAD-IA family hydrolase [Nanoarchaeota archaeon]